MDILGRPVRDMIFTFYGYIKAYSARFPQPTCDSHTYCPYPYGPHSLIPHVEVDAETLEEERLRDEEIVDEALAAHNIQSMPYEKDQDGEDASDDETVVDEEEYVQFAEHGEGLFAVTLVPAPPVQEPPPVAVIVPDVVRVPPMAIRAGLTFIPVPTYRYKPTPEPTNGEGSRSRKRPRTEDEDENGAGPSSSGYHSDPNDEDERPVKRYCRRAIDISDKRFPTLHAETEGEMYDAMEIDENDLERLQSQQEPSDVRLMFLGLDGLDDAPTAPSSPTMATMGEDFDLA